MVSVKGISVLDWKMNYLAHILTLVTVLIVNTAREKKSSYHNGSIDSHVLCMFHCSHYSLKKKKNPTKWRTCQVHTQGMYIVGKK